MGDSRAGVSSETVSENNEFVNPAFELEAPASQQQKYDKKDEEKTANHFMDFDDLLPHIGEFGCYQKLLFLLILPYTWFLVFVYFGQIFITIVPDHWCNVTELQHLDAHERFVCCIEYIHNF